MMTKNNLPNDKMSNIYADYAYIKYYKKFNINVLQHLHVKVLKKLDINHINNKLKDFEKVLNNININNYIGAYVKYLLKYKYLSLEFIKYLSLGYQKKDYSHHYKSFEIQKKIYNLPSYNDYQCALSDFSGVIYYVLNDSRVKSKKKRLLENYHYLFINKGNQSVEFFDNHLSDRLIKSADIQNIINELILLLGISKIKVLLTKKDNFNAVFNTLYYPYKDMRYTNILRAIAHELTHICTYINANNVYTHNNKKLFYLSRQNPESLLYQEGLAVFNEIYILRNYNNFRILEYALRLIFTYELINYPNNSILFERLKKIYYIYNLIYNDEFDESKSYLGYLGFLNRIKRGYDNNTNCVFLKDWNYWKGYSIVKSLNNRKDFFIGKISNITLKMVKKIGIKYDNIISPNFDVDFKTL